LYCRDTGGGFGLHKAAVVQYIHPEIIGLDLGAFFMTLFTKSFKPVGVSSVMLTFILAIFVIIGALVFLGCPTRMILKLGGGDLNALIGLFDFIVRLAIGYYFKRNGFSLGQEIKTSKKESFVYPILNIFIRITSNCSYIYIF